MNRNHFLGWLVVLGALPVATLGRVNILKNGSMELGGGPSSIDPQVADKWTEFGINVERSDTVNLIPVGEGHALKAFGDGTSSTVGGFQEVTGIAAGQSVTASVQIYSPDFDKLRGSGESGLVLEFLNLFGGTISLHEIYPFNEDSPANTWVPVTLGPLNAPSGTSKVRVTCKLKWVPGDIFGACYWDDAKITVNNGPNLLLNGDFESAGPSPGQSSVGIDFWTGFNDQEKSSDAALDGASSLKLGTREAYSGLFQNMAVLNAGDQIFMQAWVLNPSEDPLTGNSRVGLKLEFDPSGVVPPPVENLSFDADAAKDAWTLVDLEATVPDDVTIARIVYIYTGDAVTTGSVYFDSVFAERSSAPGANQLSNSSFESGPGGPNGLTSWTEFNSDGVSQAQKSCFTFFLAGICSMKAAGQSVAGIYQEITVTPGEELYVSGNLFSPGSDPLTGAGAAGVKIEWSIGGVPDDVDIGGDTNTIDASAPVDTWIPLYIDYTMPPGTNALARFTNLIEKGSALSGTVYFDACEAVVLNQFDGADSDNDGDQDLLDFAAFQRCFTGSGADELPWPCIVFDADDDNDVDLGDYDFFTDHVTPPN